jgi:hypothetical protein
VRVDTCAEPIRTCSGRRTSRLPSLACPFRPLGESASAQFTSGVTFYALVDDESLLANDVFISRELAEAALADALADEPTWASILSIVAIDVLATTRREVPRQSELN